MIKIKTKILLTNLVLIGLFISNANVLLAASSPGLSVSGTTLQDTDGARFIIEGANVEFYRDPGCTYVTDNGWTQRAQIAQKMKSLGINAIRLNYSASWLGSSSANQTKFLDFMQVFVQQGIYVMPSDHSFTGRNLNGIENTSFPLFATIVNGAKSRGIEKYLIMNPYNEPYGEDWDSYGWSHWIQKNKDTLAYLRNTLNFKELVVLDTGSWAADFDVSSMNQVKQYDATLMGGTAKVVFSNHWYPNIPISNPQNAMNNANQVPVLIGELGQYNATPLNPQYVRDVLSYAINTGIPKGFNGVFPWIWNWCDDNSMTAEWDDHVNLSPYGQIFVDNYYSKVSGGGGPILTPTPSANPTSSPTVQPTVVPTFTPSPMPSATGALRPGDANGDGKVDGLDYVVWLGNYGANIAGGAIIGDFNEDQHVDGLDYVIWLNNYDL